MVFGSYVQKVEASASLTISSATLASDGKTLTVNINGVNGSLTPASGITGFTVKLSTIPLQNSVVTSSGSTVTINLTNTVFSEQTVTVSLATSPTSNLIDTGGNTPQVQTNIAVTNNSSQQGTTVGASNASLYFLGQWSQTNSGGHNFKSLVGQNSRLDTVVNGTDADAQLSGSSGGSYTITVDGTPTVVTAPTGWTWVPIFSGLSDSAHTVSIDGRYIDTDNSLRITAPSGAGVSIPTGYGTYLPITSAPFSTYSQLDGSPAVSSAYNAYNTSAYWAIPDSGVRFSAAVTDIWIWSYGGSGTVSVYQDGIWVSNYTPSGTSWTLMHVASGLDGQSHLYQIVEVGSGNSGGRLWLYAIMLTGGIGLASEVPAVAPIISWYGDSIVAESSGNLTDSRQGDGWLVTHPLSLSSVRKGNPSQAVSTFLRDNTSQVTGLLQLPKIVFLEGGIVDEVGSKTIGDINTAGTFAGDMKTMISNMATGLPSTSTIFIRSILPNTAANYANRSLYTTAQQAAVNAYMTGSPTASAYYIATENWITPATDTVDGLHPNATGYSKIANREIPLVNGIINGSSYTVTGPSSGTTGQVSTNFTVTLPGGATFTGDQTITLSDGGSGGTFTPSVGSPGVSSVTVTPTAGLTSFTFTYTLASYYGAKTISFTNAQTWTDPTSMIYIATEDITVPSTFSLVAPSNDNSHVTRTDSLSWSVSSDSESGLAPYQLYIDGSLVTTTTSTSASLPNDLSCNETHNWYVRATDNNGNITNTSTQHFSIPCGSIALVSSPMSIVPVTATSTSATSSPTPTSSSGLTTTQISSLLTVLASFGADADTIASVQSALSGQSTPAFTPSTDSGQTGFARDLKLNSTGPDVQALQQFLNSHGFPVATAGPGSKGNETETFGLLTQSALIKFQKVNGIVPAVGYLGPITREKISTL